MKTTFSKPISFVLGITALTVASSQLPAKAETAAVAPAELALAETATVTPETTFVLTNQVQPANTAATPVASSAQPLPGTAATDAASLSKQPEAYAPFAVSENQPAPADYKIAQGEIIPGRATRSGYSYVGVAGNIGFGGNSALGRGNFAVISKIGLTETFSVRPAAIFGDQTVFLIPVTYDFAIQQTDPFEPVPYAPYVGAGISIATGASSAVGFLLSGGVDLPLTKQFTATAGLNISLRDRTDVGLLIGIGYNFQGF